MFWAESKRKTKGLAKTKWKNKTPNHSRCPIRNEGLLKPAVGLATHVSTKTTPCGGDSWALNTSFYIRILEKHANSCIKAHIKEGVRTGAANRCSYCKIFFTSFLAKSLSPARICISSFIFSWGVTGMKFLIWVHSSPQHLPDSLFPTGSEDRPEAACAFTKHFWAAAALGPVR